MVSIKGVIMEKYQEIERSIIKKFRKEIWRQFVKAVKDYELIKENDKIMVCISGGKDSFLLAKCITILRSLSLSLFFFLHTKMCSLLFYFYYF